MTIKQFCWTMIVVAFCLSTVPILPQKPASRALTRRVATPAASAARGRVPAQKVGAAKVQVGQAAAVVAQSPAAAGAAVVVPVAQPVVTPTTTVAVTPAVAGGPTVVSPVAVPPIVTDENKKKAWLEMQDALNILLGAQVFFHPIIAPYNEAPTVDDLWTSTDARAVFKFSVAAKQDAVIQLVGETVRTITIGANNNTNFIVRVGDINAPAITIPVTSGMTVLDGETVYTQLWVSYNKTNGELKIGKGVLDTNVLMTWTDPTPLKNAAIKLGLGGWANAAGSKVFYTNIYVVLPTGACVLAAAGQPAVTAVAAPVASTPATIATPTQPAGTLATSTAPTVPGASAKKLPAARGRALARGKTATAPATQTAAASVGQVASTASVKPETSAPARKTATRRTR